MLFKEIIAVYNENQNWGISVSIVSDCRLDDRGSIPDTGKGLFL
jgi:hypothetical protein